MNGRKVADALLKPCSPLNNNKWHRLTPKPAPVTVSITSYKMRREGQFLAKLINDHTKCGPKTAQPIYTYEVILECDPVLDANGFIIDNLTVHQYFIDTYGTKPLPAVSCERMAAHAVKYIKRECDRARTQVRKISVTISGMPGAYLTAEWSR